MISECRGFFEWIVLRVIPQYEPAFVMQVMFSPSFFVSSRWKMKMLSVFISYSEIVVNDAAVHQFLQCNV